MLTTCPIFMRRNINDSLILHFQWLHRFFLLLLLFWSCCGKIPLYILRWLLRGFINRTKNPILCFFSLLGINLFLFSWAKKNLHWEFILFLVWLTLTLYGNIFFYIILSSYRLQILLWKHQKYSFTISYISLEMSHNLWYACHFSLLFRNHKIWNDIEICLLTIEKYFNSNAWYERKKMFEHATSLEFIFNFPSPTHEWFAIHTSELNAWVNWKAKKEQQLVLNIYLIKKYSENWLFSLSQRSIFLCIIIAIN